MSRLITVNAKDGENAYTLTRDADENTAKLEVKGVITPKLARDLVEDLTPLAGVKKRGLPRQRQSQAMPAPKPDADKG